MSPKERKPSKAELESQAEALRVELLNAQFDLSGRDDLRLVVVVAGDDRIGCEQALDRLYEWLDARAIDLVVLPADTTPEQSQRPLLWRYWRELPPGGRTGIVFGGWPMRTLADRIFDGGKALYEQRVEHIRAFERLLADDGTEFLKLWLHLPRKQHAKRLEKAGKKPGKAWEVGELDHKVFEHYDEAMPIVREFVQRTEADHAPWIEVDGKDGRERDLVIGRAILAAYGRLLERPERPRHPSRPEHAVPARPTPAPPGEPGALERVDLSASLPADEYEDRLHELQVRLNRLVRKARKREVSSVLGFEGWDAGGKGGAIRRVMAAMSARDAKVVSIAAPSEEELRHHYLWRFWCRLPSAGRMLIFDRTWYGRVLVERVEGLATEDEWSRAYGEINDFEAQLTEHGIYLGKFWLHIDPAEQLRRFEARAETPYKKYKLTREDYRNRDKWDAYAAAANRMIAETDTTDAPWTVVPANDKRYARVLILETVCAGLERVL